MMTKEMVLFESSDGKLALPVQMDGNTVWLSQQQMAELFEKDRTVIAKHIKNAIEEGEIDPKVVCANFAHTTRHGAMVDKVQQHEIVCYNLDVVISVGYRVHSQRGVEFRRWAPSRVPKRRK